MSVSGGIEVAARGRVASEAERGQAVAPAAHAREGAVRGPRNQTAQEERPRERPTQEVI